MKKDIDLIKQYPPWRKEQIESIKIGFFLFLFGLATTSIITYFTFTIIIFNSVQPFLITIIAGAILLLIFNFIPGGMMIIGACGFFGDLSESIMDSYRLWKYNGGGEESA